MPGMFSQLTLSMNVLRAIGASVKVGTGTVFDHRNNTFDTLAVNCLSRLNNTLFDSLDTFCTQLSSHSLDFVSFPLVVHIMNVGIEHKDPE